jgi:sugar phosphate isomerase/epimerase
MKYAICNETFLDWPLDDAFAFARACGYTGIEFAPFTLAADATQIDSRQCADVRRLLDKHQLQGIGLHWLLAKTSGYYLTSPDPAVRQRTAGYLGELARVCRGLGGHLMVLGSPQQRNLLPGVSHAQAMDHAAEVLRMAAPALEQHQVVLAIEPLGPVEGDFLNTAARGVELAEMVDSPQVRLHLDVKAMSTESIPIPDILRASAKHLVHFHANDPNRRGPGMGDVDFVPILAALREIGYDGWISVEVFDYEPGPERLAKESIDYLRKLEP